MEGTDSSFEKKKQGESEDFGNAELAGVNWDEQGVTKIRNVTHDSLYTLRNLYVYACFVFLEALFLDTLFGVWKWKWSGPTLVFEQSNFNLRVATGELGWWRMLGPGIMVMVEFSCS